LRKISTRTEKIGSVIQKALAREMLPFEGEHGLITISEVKVMPDLSEAHIYVGATRSGKRLIEKLNARAGVLKKEISKSLMQKRTPKLLFRLDLGRIAANKIDDLLNK
jgi:ribosome-binding factor A